MDVKENIQIFTVVLDEQLDGEDGRLLMRKASIIESIEIMPLHIHPVRAMKHTVRIDKGHNQDHKHPPEKLSLRGVRDEVFEEALQHEGRRGFSRVHPAGQHDNGLGELVRPTFQLVVGEQTF